MVSWPLLGQESHLTFDSYFQLILGRVGHMTNCNYLESKPPNEDNLFILVLITNFQKKVLKCFMKVKLTEKLHIHSGFRKTWFWKKSTKHNELIETQVFQWIKQSPQPTTLHAFRHPVSGLSWEQVQLDQSNKSNLRIY